MNAIIDLVNIIFHIYSLILLARIIISWVGDVVPPNVSRFLYTITEPVLGPCRELVFAIIRAFGGNPNAMMIDFSPIIAFMLLDNVVRPAVVKVIAMIFMAR